MSIFLVLVSLLSLSMDAVVMAKKCSTCAAMACDQRCDAPASTATKAQIDAYNQLNDVQIYLEALANSCGLDIRNLIFALQGHLQKTAQNSTMQNEILAHGVLRDLMSALALRLKIGLAPKSTMKMKMKMKMQGIAPPPQQRDLDFEERDEIEEMEEMEEDDYYGYGGVFVKYTPNYGSMSLETDECALNECIFAGIPHLRSSRYTTKVDFGEVSQGYITGAEVVGAKAIERGECTDPDGRTVVVYFATGPPNPKMNEWWDPKKFMTFVIVVTADGKNVDQQGNPIDQAWKERTGVTTVANLKFNPELVESAFYRAECKRKLCCVDEKKLDGDKAYKYPVRRRSLESRDVMSYLDEEPIAVEDVYKTTKLKPRQVSLGKWVHDMNGMTFGFMGSDRDFQDMAMKEYGEEFMLD